MFLDFAAALFAWALKIQRFIPIYYLLYRFIGSDNPDTYFSDTQRTRVAYEILETAPYGKRQRGEIGTELNFFHLVKSVSEQMQLSFFRICSGNRGFNQS